MLLIEYRKRNLVAYCLVAVIVELLEKLMLYWCLRDSFQRRVLALNLIAEQVAKKLKRKALEAQAQALEAQTDLALAYSSQQINQLVCSLTSSAN